MESVPAPPRRGKKRLLLLKAPGALAALAALALPRLYRARNTAEPSRSVRGCGCAALGCAGGRWTWRINCSAQRRRLAAPARPASRFKDSTATALRGAARAAPPWPRSICPTIAVPAARRRGQVEQGVGAEAGGMLEALGLLRRGHVALPSQGCLPVSACAAWLRRPARGPGRAPRAASLNRQPQPERTADLCGSSKDLPSPAAAVQHCG